MRIEVDDVNNLIRFKQELLRSMDKFRQCQTDISGTLKAIGTSWDDNKYQEFYQRYFSTSDKDLETVIQTMQQLANHLQTKIDPILAYQRLQCTT